MRGGGGFDGGGGLGMEGGLRRGLLEVGNLGGDSRDERLKGANSRSWVEYVLVHAKMLCYVQIRQS